MLACIDSVIVLHRLHSSQGVSSESPIGSPRTSTQTHSVHHAFGGVDRWATVSQGINPPHRFKQGSDKGEVLGRSFRAVIAAIICCLWLATGSAISTRMQLVFDYSTLPSVPAELEVLAVPSGVFCLLLICALGLFGALYQATINFGVSSNLALACGLVCNLPLALLIARSMGIAVPQAAWWEIVWFAIFTGASVGLALHQSPTGPRARWQAFTIAMSPRICFSIALACVVLATVWWYLQSDHYFREFQLGFNDFAHFTQRINSTLRGHGFLRESPVLPPFWDHFNPGLTLLIPIWGACPYASTIFLIQSVCLAGSALLVFAIARAHGCPGLVALLWSLAWLAIPSIGQMNLAYTYGWHPITLAIPCLLASYWCLVRERGYWAIAFAILGCSFEEGVIAAIGCYAAANLLRTLMEARTRSSVDPPSDQKCLRTGTVRSWGIVFIAAVVAFALVYRFSGLAQFQTARFARLGSGPFEIVLSPVLKPAVFLELFFRERNLAFLSFLLAPFVICVSGRFLWTVLAISVPMAVLLLWEHMPAQSLAFQYASCLLPIVFVGAIESSSSKRQNPAGIAISHAWACFSTSFIMAIFVGQMPWSLDSLIDVKTKTYGIDGDARRQLGSDDNAWIRTTIDRIRTRGRIVDSMAVPLEGLRVLATGRIAAHFLGAKDIETVGQFWQRYSDLARLDTSLPSPVVRYDVIVLDHRETFQQSTDEISRIKSEALAHGYSVIESRHSVDVLEKTTER